MKTRMAVFLHNIELAESYNTLIKKRVQKETGVTVSEYGCLSGNFHLYHGSIRGTYLRGSGKVTNLITHSNNVMSYSSLEETVKKFNKAANLIKAIEEEII